MKICANCSRVCGDEERFCVSCGTETRPSKYCTHCGQANDEDADYCIMCGKAFGEKCSRCGAVNNEENRFCFSCGNQLNVSSTVFSTEKETVTDRAEAKDASVVEINEEEPPKPTEPIAVPKVKTLPALATVAIFLLAFAVLFIICTVI